MIQLTNDSADRHHLGYEVRKTLRKAAIPIQVRIENSDVDTLRPLRGQQAAEDIRGFVPAHAAGVPVVHGRHQVVIENIDVEVHPEPLGIRAAGGGQRFADSGGGTAFPDFWQVNNGRGRVADVLAQEPVVVAEHPVPDERDILVPDEWPEPLQVSEHLQAASCREGEVERGYLAVRLVARVLEIGMSVDEGQAVAAPATQRQHRPGHDAAVAAEDDREAAAVKRRIHSGSKVACDSRNPLRIQDPHLRITDITVRRNAHTHLVSRAEARMQASLPQCAGARFHPTRPQAKTGRHVDNEGIHW